MRDQQADHLKRRKEIWEAKSVSRQVDAKPQGGRPEGFAASVEKATGIDRRTTQRAISRAEKIPEPIRQQIEGTNWIVVVAWYVCTHKTFYGGY